MKVTILKSKNYEDVISRCYATDQELIDKYHVLAPVDLEDAIKDTVSVFANAHELSKFTFYEIHKGNNLVGYFGIENLNGIALLSGYFIMPEYRTKEFLIQFMRIVKSKLPSTFFTALYEKNVRAEKFLKKNNFVRYGKQYAPERRQNMLIYKFN